jgi:beta-galactosidase
VCLAGQFAAGVNVQRRTDGTHDFLFVMNFTDTMQQVALDQTYTDLLTAQKVTGTLQLAPYGVQVLRTE